MARQKNDGRGRIGGRQKGTPNKDRAALCDMLLDIVAENLPKVRADLEALPPRDRVAMVEKLMSYVLPRMQAVEAKVETSEARRVDLSRVPEADLAAMAEKLRGAVVEAAGA